MTSQPEDSGPGARSSVGSSGFVLVLVLMATAVIATTAMVLTTWTRSTATTAATVTHIARAHAAAEAGVVRLTHMLRSVDDPLRPQLQENHGSALWTFADAKIELSIERESGKVDLNTGDPELIAAFLHAALPESPLRSRLEETLLDPTRLNQLPSVVSVLSRCERLGLEAKRLSDFFTVLTQSKGIAPRSAGPARLALIPSMTAHDIEFVGRLLRSGHLAFDDRRLVHVRRYLSRDLPIYTLRASAVTSNGIRRQRSAVVVLLPRSPHVGLVSVGQPIQPAQLSCADD